MMNAEGKNISPSITFTKEVGADQHGRYLASFEGHDGFAELNFTHRHKGLISIDHVGAPQHLRGTGLASALVKHVISDARDLSFKIIPKCPYVAKLYERHPDWADVITAKPK